MDTLPLGSIPVRFDVASNPAITNDPLLKPYAAEVKNNPGVFPPTAIKPADVNEEYTIVGQAWSSVIAGGSPQKAAATLLPQLLKLIV